MKRWHWAVLLAALLAITGWIFSRQILWQLGAIQVEAGAPSDSDAIVVLGGDYLGNRILKAAELAREGYAPFVLVSGAGSVYGVHESTLAIDFATKHGYARNQLVALNNPAFSTADEARYIIDELHKRGIRKYMIVTSPNHSGRARAIFHNAGPDLDLRMVASNDPVWRQGDWWTRREGQKLWFFEETKRIVETGWF